MADLVTDLDMPGLSGRALIQAARLAEHGQAQARLIVVCLGGEDPRLQPAGTQTLPRDA